MLCVGKWDRVQGEGGGLRGGGSLSGAPYQEQFVPSRVGGVNESKRLGE